MCRWRTSSIDCEDRFCSLMVMGCGPATAGVTLHLTGLVPFWGLVRSWSPARPGRSSWPDQELDRRALAARGVSHHSPAESPPRTGTTSRPGKERTHDQSD